MADRHGLEPCGRNPVEVQVLPAAHLNERINLNMPKFFSKTKGRTKLAYRTPDWFKKAVKYQQTNRKMNFPQKVQQGSSRH